MGLCSKPSSNTLEKANLVNTKHILLISGEGEIRQGIYNNNGLVSLFVTLLVGRIVRYK